ncbi:hypothetical protein Vadar_027960 [Vaccinium darrowii]|uniref:Uncharacterized protein n=1 Tax=Vaccinium darrowii TaxID=229202 RepID=A0ACB7ZMV6_9ERIC|nr:hypothetical protein Vadar_027960 [Vaccinium darrowii]
MFSELSNNVADFSFNIFVSYELDGVIYDDIDYSIQAMAQLVSVIMLQPEVGGNRETLAFAGLHQVKFRKPVIAGDTLVMRATMTKLQRQLGFAKMEAKALRMRERENTAERRGRE